MPIPANLHKNHRERLRQRYLKSGIDSLAEHEVLELVLFYALPRVDTNDTAHRLLELFGSVSAVFEAPIDELAGVRGLSYSSAALLKLIFDINARSLCASHTVKYMNDYDEVGKRLAEDFRYDSTERVVMVLLDSKDALIYIGTLSQGDFSSAKVSMRMLVHTVMLKNAAKVILAHNHPDGSTSPSVSDKAMTISIEDVLNQIGVELKEHYIIAGDNYIGIKHASLDSLRVTRSNGVRDKGIIN